MPGEYAAFSPGGGAALISSKFAVGWWNTADWQVYRTIDLSGEPARGFNPYGPPRFIAEDVFVVDLLRNSDAGEGKVFVRNLPKPIGADGGFEFGFDPAPLTGPLCASRNGRLVVIGNRIYDAVSGERLTLPRGRNYHPRLSEFADDGRFASLGDLYIVDLAADRKIDMAGRFVKSLQTWVVLGFDNLTILRKADASLSAELLQKWCQVITRGKLDEGGRFSKFDEATWQKARLELAQLLDANPVAQSLRFAVTDPLYWLRQEIKDSEGKNLTPLPLLDRLVAAEPTWPNYSKRAAAHAKLEHWDLAMRDELEAARLTGERYWLGGSPFTDWQLAVSVVMAPDRPREQYELLLCWLEARGRAGVSDEPTTGGSGNLAPQTSQYQPRRPVLTGLAQFRLGRYADALATLQGAKVPMFAEAAGMLMSPWSLLILMNVERPAGPLVAARRVSIRTYAFDPVDLMVRAMCHHHLGHPQEARAWLEQARDMFPKDRQSINAGQVAFLREAESLIEGKTQP